MIDVYAAYRAVIQAWIDLQANGLRPNEGIPGLIAVDDRSRILTDRAMEAEIARVADWTRQQHPQFRATHAVAEIRATIRHAFGPALARLDLDDDLDANAQRLKLAVETELEYRLTGPLPIEFVVGCRLFSRPVRTAFSIGPVSFEPPDLWLDRKLSIGAVSKVTARRIRLTRIGARLKARKPTGDSSSERAIQDVLVGAQLVCTVVTNGLAPRAAEDRGLVAARMAITAIALLWERPSRALAGMQLGCDAPPRNVALLISQPDEAPMGSWRWVGDPHGTHIEIENWEQLFGNNARYFELAGRLAECWATAGLYEAAGSLHQALAQSLKFFWQACHDEDHLLAIVKFTAALEALAGGKEEAIVQLLEARLGLERQSELTAGRTVSHILKEIYGKARSQTLHGSNPDVAYDWADTRDIAERLARHAVVACMGWALSHPHSTDRTQLRAPNGHDGAFKARA